MFRTICLAMYNALAYTAQVRERVDKQAKDDLNSLAGGTTGPHDQPEL